MECTAENVGGRISETLLYGYGFVESQRIYYIGTFHLAGEALGHRHRTFHMPRGTRWGSKWEYGWFLTEWTVPKKAAGKRLIAVLGVGKEMLVWVNGQERGSIDRKHPFLTLTESAVEGEMFTLVAECYAGHGKRLENGGFYTIEDIPVPEPEEKQVIIEDSFIAVWQEELYQTAMDYLTLYSLFQSLPDKSLRAMKIAKALKEFTYRADFELLEPELTENLKKAGEWLKPLLSCVNGSTAPEFTIFGQSHLDLAWLWTKEETRRKAARTYANQLVLMEEYPEYQFLLCEPPVLDYLKESYPNLWNRVKEKAESGQMLPEGAMHVECDTNMPSGESLVRQFLYGIKWFQENLGIKSRLAWMPDTFGFSGALPQIMKQCGGEYFTTQKLLRQDPEGESFPYNDFWWEGIDESIYYL